MPGELAHTKGRPAVALEVERRDARVVEVCLAQRARPQERRRDPSEGVVVEEHEGEGRGVPQGRREVGERVVLGVELLEGRQRADAVREGT